MSVCLLLIRVYVFAHVSQLNEYLPTEPFAGGKKKKPHAHSYISFLESSFLYERT